MRKYTSSYTTGYSKPFRYIMRTTRNYGDHEFKWTTTWFYKRLRGKKIRFK